MRNNAGSLTTPSEEIVVILTNRSMLSCQLLSPSSQTKRKHGFGEEHAEGGNDDRSHVGRNLLGVASGRQRQRERPPSSTARTRRARELDGSSAATYAVPARLGERLEVRAPRHAREHAPDVRSSRPRRNGRRGFVLVVRWIAAVVFLVTSISVTTAPSCQRSAR
jgi:hypothetical protein